MRIAAYQFAVTGDMVENFEKIKNAILLAKKNAVQLLVFPECALTGYPPRDIKSSSEVRFDLVEDCCKKLQELSDETGIALLVGTIYRADQIYNRAILFQPNQPVWFYDKRALWGWDREHFAQGSCDGIFEIAGISVGVRICFEVRFPEYFRELYARKTDLNVVLFYDVSDVDDTGRYDLIKGHLQTRAVENVSTIVSVDSIHPYQTAPTAVFGKSGQILNECTRNQPELLIYDFEKTEDDFGETGRRTMSDTLCFEGK